MSSDVHRPARLTNPRVKIVLILALLALIAVLAYPAVGYLHGTWHWQKAQKAIAERDFSKAQSHLDACRRAWPDSAEAAFLAARTARRAGDLSAAARNLKDAHKLKFVPQQLDLEESLLEAQSGNHTSVAGYLLLCLRKDHPDSILILEVLVPAALRALDFLLASECLDIWVKIEPNNPRPHIDRGELKERLRFKDEALDEFQLAVQCDPESAEARLRLGRLLMEMRHPEDAAVQYEWLAQYQPDDPKVRLGLARCRYNLGQNEDARLLLDALLRDQPKNGAALCLRGEIELNSGRPTEAERWFREALAQMPYDIELLYNLETSLNVQGKKDEAETIKKRRESAQADQADVGKFLLEMQRNPSDPEPRRQLAIRMMRNGLESAAKRWLDVALRQDPFYAPTLETMADYYDKVGDARNSADFRARAKALPAKPK